MLRHPVCADRVELDRAHTGSEIVFRVNERGSMATCLECPRTRVTWIEILDVIAPEHVHHVPDAFFVKGGHQQMHMIRHQHRGVENTMMLLRRFI